MKLFMCWAGDLSKVVAEAFYEHIQDSPIRVDPFFSPEGIASGKKWPSEISANLEESNYGWLFMTKENLENQWIHFEAGSLGKHEATSHVCPILIDITATELDSPLSHFQARKCEKNDILKALIDLNAASEDAIDNARLEKSLGRSWEEIDRKIAEAKSKASSGTAKEKKSEREILEELLTETRLSRSWQEEFSRKQAAEKVPFTGGTGSYVYTDPPTVVTTNVPWTDLFPGVTYVAKDGREFNAGVRVRHLAYGDGTARAFNKATDSAFVVFDSSGGGMPVPVSCSELTII